MNSKETVEAFFEAVETGDTALARDMLKNFSSLITEEDQYGKSSLHIAAIEGDVDTAEMLISAGARIDAQDRWGRTPLMVGIYVEPLAEHLPVVNLLVSKGANLNLSDQDGLTALHVASLGEAEIVQLLLSHNADVNAVDHNGMTPLHNAVLHPEIDVVKALLQAEGIDVSIRNNEGMTPLDIAKLKNWNNLVKAIEAKKALR